MLLLESRGNLLLGFPFAAPSANYTLRLTQIDTMGLTLNFESFPPRFYPFNRNRYGKTLEGAPECDFSSIYSSEWWIVKTIRLFISDCGGNLIGTFLRKRFNKGGAPFCSVQNSKPSIILSLPIPECVQREILPQKHPLVKKCKISRSEQKIVPLQRRQIYFRL